MSRFTQRWHQRWAMTRRAGGGGGGFSPVDVPGLGLFLHAPYEGGNEPAALSAYAQNPTIGDGDPVETATDWSGSNQHPTQATLSRRPTWEAAAHNGLHAFEFDGADDRWLAPFEGSSDIWIAGMLRRDAGTIRFLLHWGVAFVKPRWYVTPGVGQNLTNMIGPVGSAIRAGDWAEFTPVSRFNSKITEDSADHTIELNDVSLHTIPGTSTTTTIALTTQDLEIGARGGSFAFQGIIGTLCVFTEQPSVDDKQAVNDWLDAEWGLP